MLHIKDSKIVDIKTNKEVKLRGVNLGGWLMMEGYILGGRNIPESEFKRRFKKVNGEAALKEFEYYFRKNFINQKDIEYIKKLGFNCVRVPFHWKIAYEEIIWLDEVIKWCEQNKIYCILDMHSVPGSQNGDWHSDPVKISKSLFWDKKNFHKKYYELWDLISKRYKNKEIIAGYDIMNEPVMRKKNWAKILADVYNNVIEIIRKNSDNHIIFVEGNLWATQYDFLNYLDYKNHKNVAISIHFYYPVDFTFNLDHSLKYPSKILNKYKLRSILKKYLEISKKFNMPIYVGEFGVNLRCYNSCYGEKQYLKDVISIFEEFGYHWTIWTYKTIYINVQPSGLLLYEKNPPFISRQENEFGWERYILDWKKFSKQIKTSWLSKNFSFGLIKVLLEIFNKPLDKKI